MKLIHQICFYGLTAVFLQTTIISCQRAATYESQLEHFDKVPSSPRIVKSAKYISPQVALSAKNRRPRRKTSAQKSTHDTDTFSYIDRYHEFLDKNFNDRLKRLETQKKRPTDVSSHESSSDDDDDNEYKSDYFPSNEYAKIKAESDAQAAEIRKDPKHCKQVTKGDMTCFTCNNPETGAQSQSCSYSSEPVSKKYAYQKEKKYDSKNQEPEDEDEHDNDDNENSEEDDNVEVVDKRRKLSQGKRSESIKLEPRLEKIVSKDDENKKPVRTVQKSNYKTLENRPQRDIVGVASSFFAHFGSTEDDIINPTNSDKIQSYDDYYRQVFPAKTKEKLLQPPAANMDDADFEFVDDDFAAKKDVEKALAEFKVKDWSSCDEMVRGDMTCYSCKDKGGVEHEECVYVSETRPDVAVVAAQSQTVATTEKVRKRPLKKATSIKKSAKSLKATKKSKTVPGKLKPSEIKDNKAKQTIKRKVIIKVDDEMEPQKSRSMHYEHHVSHVE